MEFESRVKDIQRLVKAISGKDVDVFITYRTALGITKPWHIKCDIKEADHESCEGAASLLYAQLSEELKRKIISAENQAANYREAYHTILGLTNKVSSKSVSDADYSCPYHEIS